MSRVTYYPDYDKVNGIKLTNIDEKIDYLEGRINLILIKPIKDFFNLRKKRDLWHLNLGICTLICDGISGLCTFYYKYGSKKKPYGTQFKNFIIEFVYPSNSQNQEYAELLWHKFRCSLSHGFILEGGNIETGSSKHLDYDTKHKKLILDLESYFNDFQFGCNNFFSKLRKKDPKTIDFFQERFDKKFSAII